MGSDVDLTQLAVDRQPVATARRRHLFSRYVLPITLLLGFLGLVVWAAGDFLLPPRAVTVVPVRTARGEVQRAGTPLFKSAGWIEPRPTAVRVAALAPGVVERLLVVEDQLLEAGEPVAELIKQDALLVLDYATASRELRVAEREEAQAMLDAATTRLERPLHLIAALGEADANLAHVERLLNQLPFETRRATVDLEFAKRNYEGKNAATEVVSQRAIEQARSVMDSAQATLEEIQSRRTSLQTELDALAVRRDSLQEQLALKIEETRAKREAESQFQAAEARVRQAEIEVQEAKLRLDRMTVRAPVTGRILQIVAPPGSRLIEGRGHTAEHDASTVVTMYQPESLQVRVDVRFEDIPQVVFGQPVRIESRATPKPLLGQVLFVGSEADIQKNTLQVKVAIQDSPGVFKPDMLVDITFLAPRVERQDPASNEGLRILVPSRLVQQAEAGPFVWVADQSARRARKTLIEIGDETADGFTEVTRGLDLTNRLIAPPHEELVDKMRIRVVGEEVENGTR